MHKDIAKWQQRNTDLEIKSKTHRDQIGVLEQTFNKHRFLNADFRSIATEALESINDFVDLQVRIQK
jgi:hypothetical protein